MSWTTHGHHVEGTYDVGRPPAAKARCGGPGLCSQCSYEAAAAQKRVHISSADDGAPFQAKSPPEDFQNYARTLVHNYVQAKTPLDFDDVYVVMFTYILGSWKCLISTDIQDGMYYEVTHNKGTGQTYLDAYRRIDNQMYSD